eukprot:TRINITY_DN1275_c0_g3_i1.p1 TRINITY_DN1275_c0_g3~~TRINITY_DN1275_c0_g3_i1.p1  ORF type:complete len:204 (-),score=59.36 TRINITY_DN1275_c0_g3_i1:36-647(-)
MSAVPHAALVVCGPSGVGKGTVLDSLTSKYPATFGRCVSHTTRDPRPGEQNGVHYHFVSKEHIDKMIAENGFVEYAQVHGNTYGTSKDALKFVQDEGKICIIEIDIQGAQQVKKAGLEPQPKFIFISPPSMEDLEARLRGRGTEKEEKIQLRLKNAAGEVEFSKTEGFFDIVIPNINVDTTVQELLTTFAQWYPDVFPAAAAQ